MSRLVCWWSAGDASAVAAALALRSIDADEKVVAYCASVEGNEHEDNGRFLLDCERWCGQPIIKVYSEDYKDTWDVYERTRWLVGVAGARCTTELKKIPRRGFQRPDDIQTFGFTVEERDRAERFTANNPEAIARYPLIERGLTKADCHALVRAEGIAPPAMYGQGYKNNNCIGCVKGGAGYWNKIRVDYPVVFLRMAKLERSIDAAILKRTEKGHRVRVFLDELDPKVGRYESEPDIECGVACEAARAVLEPR